MGEGRNWRTSARCIRRGIPAAWNRSQQNRHWLESTVRTLEAMVKDGLLERYRSREARSIVLGGETSATVVRYGLPGTVSVVRDTEGPDNTIAGKCVRLSEDPSGIRIS